MAKATEAQIKQLEKAHKIALGNLLQAIRFRYIIFQKLGKDSSEWKKYADMIWKMWQSWYARQIKYEMTGQVQKEGILKDDWLTPEGRKKLEELLKRWDAEGKGIGIVPLIIWGIIALAGLFTAEQVVDELNTTAEEQQELLTETDRICKENKFDAETCKKFMTQQTETLQANTGGSGLPWGKLLLVGAAAYLFMNRDKFFKSKTA